MTHHRFLVIFAVLTLALTLAVPVAAPASPRPRPAAQATPGPHREIRTAISALQQVREHLQNADQDFGGHRTVAIHAIDQTLLELRLCQQYEKD
jgi:hypothetical protein